MKTVMPLSDRFEVCEYGSGLLNKIDAGISRRGQPVGCAHGGYWKTNIPGGKQSSCHRVKWELVHGPIPDGMVIDHVNGNGLDNRIANLRLATNKENIRNAKISKNNTSGIKGVRWCSTRNKWHAFIRVNYVMKNLGRYDTKGMAAVAYAKACIKHFGRFGRIECYPDRFP